MLINPNQLSLNSLIPILPTYGKVIEPFTRIYKMPFIYVIVFPDNSYHILIDNIEFLKEFVSTIKKGHIFCKRNITQFPNCGLIFTSWKDLPESPIEWLYWKYGMRNGITEMWGVAGDKSDKKAQTFLAENQHVLITFIRYFIRHKGSLGLSDKGSFHLEQDFDRCIPEPCFLQEMQDAQNLLISTSDNPDSVAKISTTEWKVLHCVARGFTYKLSARECGVKPRTIKHSLETIRDKTGFHYKPDLTKLVLDVNGGFVLNW